MENLFICKAYNSGAPTKAMALVCLCVCVQVCVSVCVFDTVCVGGSSPALAASIRSHLRRYERAAPLTAYIHT